MVIDLTSMLIKPAHESNVLERRPLFTNLLITTPLL